MISKTDTMDCRLFCLLLMALFSRAGYSQKLYQELYRPLVHFSPAAHWMNDPNGLVYYGGVYHMFFQFYPDSTVWGPMHWGHATSADLLHWKEQPIALYPDSLGYIFSGSAVVDSLNSSGFGSGNHIPLVAMFTIHDPAGEKAGTSHYQNQGIAYSTNGGVTWTKYAGNPVLKTPGLKDFRDPKVFWLADQKKWIVTIAAGDRVMFYSSRDLKTWSKESEYGSGLGAHGGVWECPDLISLHADGKKIWMLIVSINPGGYQGGSGTQYFTGDFDGHQFRPSDTVTRWLDYGADNYAGVTFSNTGKEKIFIGWMSNWQYAMKVPTEKWRSAMTIPRILSVKNLNGVYYSVQKPVSLKPISEREFIDSGALPIDGPQRFDFTCNELQNFILTFSNSKGQELRIGFDKGKNAFFIDRSNAGRSDFSTTFAAIHYGARIATSNQSNLTVILDNASIEMFADDGLTTITDIFFPDQPFQKFRMQSNPVIFDRIKISKLRSIWPSN